jgi:ribosomal-protein-alanine N-acetyltransferase
MQSPGAPAVRSLASRFLMWWHAGTPHIRYERISLHGQGFALRAFSRDDLPRLLEIFRDPAIARFSHLPRDWQTESGALDYIESLPRLAASGQRVDLAIEDLRDRSLIGHVALREISWRKRSARVATWMAPDARKHGVASRAIDLISQWGFSELRLLCIDADPDDENLPAHRMLERAGYERVRTVPPQEGDGRTIALYVRFHEGSSRRSVPGFGRIRYSFAATDRV